MKTQHLAFLCALLPAFVTLPGNAQTPAIGQIQQSHIEGNVPPSEDQFMRLLHRDLTAYLRSKDIKVEKLELDLLRKAPTQSGVSYPKYYVWVKEAGSANPVVEGAARVEAIDRDYFNVTHFLLASDIRDGSVDPAKTFPALLVPDIKARAQAK